MQPCRTNHYFIRFAIFPCQCTRSKRRRQAFCGAIPYSSACFSRQRACTPRLATSTSMLRSEPLPIPSSLAHRQPSDPLPPTRVLKNQALSPRPPPQEGKMNLGDTLRPPAGGLRPPALPVFQQPATLSSCTPVGPPPPKSTTSSSPTRSGGRRARRATVFRRYHSRIPLPLCAKPFSTKQCHRRYAPLARACAGEHTPYGSSGQTRRAATTPHTPPPSGSAHDQQATRESPPPRLPVAHRPPTLDS